ncbi:hypothetical protein L9F63_027873, partial [Diploptera punctata]
LPSPNPVVPFVAGVWRRSQRHHPSAPTSVVSIHECHYHPHSQQNLIHNNGDSAPPQPQTIPSTQAISIVEKEKTIIYIFFENVNVLHIRKNPDSASKSYNLKIVLNPRTADYSRGGGQWTPPSIAANSSSLLKIPCTVRRL